MGNRSRQSWMKRRRKALRDGSLKSAIAPPKEYLEKAHVKPPAQAARPGEVVKVAWDLVK